MRFFSIAPIDRNSFRFGFDFQIDLRNGFFMRLRKVRKGAERLGMVSFGKFWFWRSALALRELSPPFYRAKLHVFSGFSSATGDP